MKRILFRADAKPSIGIGDLVSLINISKYFEVAGWEVFFLIRSYYSGVEVTKKRISKNVTIINEHMSIDDEIGVINNIVKKYDIVVLFFEITERPLTDYKDLSEKPLKVCVSFDGAIWRDTDLVISWAPDADMLFDTGKYPKTKFLLGYEYVILPIEFYRDGRINKRSHPYRPENILVAMGGIDENNITRKVVDCLIKNEISINLNIIIGAGYADRLELESSLSNYAGTYTIKQNVTNIIEEYLASDAAIAAGGLTSSELVASRTPAMLIAAFEHQIKRCEFFDNKGWASYLGFRNFDEKKLLRNLDITPKTADCMPFNTYKIVETINELTS